MAGSGPAPNPASRRQTTGSTASSWLELPAGGYDGPTPDWPLVSNVIAGGLEGDDPDDVLAAARARALDARELDLWSTIWRSPQAAAWKLNGWTHDVGLYVRSFVLGEFGDLDHVKEARMWSDRLGLNPMAMLKNRWRVRTDEVSAKREETAKKTPRKRLKVVDSDAVAGS